MTTTISQARYSYRYNHSWLSIYRDNRMAAVIQGKRAKQLVDTLNVAPDSIQQLILKSEDCTVEDLEDDRQQTVGEYLESLIDEYSLSHVLGLIADICGDKAEGILYHWQDTRSAKAWSDVACAVMDVVLSTDC